MGLQLQKYQYNPENDGGMVGFMKRNKKAIFNVGMGLGKTISVLYYIDKFLKPKNMLIIAPKRVSETVWLQEAKKWGLEIEKKMIICSSPTFKLKLNLYSQDYPYKIISRDNIKYCKGMKFDIVIIDELTSFKSTESNRSKYLQDIEFERCYGLTGTFIPNDYTDIFGQLAAVKLYKIKNFYRWRATYFYNAKANSGQKGKEWKLNDGYTVNDILEPVKKYIYTLSSEDYLNIPSVIYDNEEVNLSPSEYDRIMELNATLKCQINKNDFFACESNMSKFAKLQTLVNGFVYDNEENIDELTDKVKIIRHVYRSNEFTKLNKVIDYVVDCVERNENVLLFYAFKEEVVYLAEKLKEYKIKFCSVSDKNFMDRINKKNINVLFAHPASAGHGLNLQHFARICVWSTFTWNYEYFAQANARLARQGQKDSVIIKSFTAANTIELRILKAITEKAKNDKEFTEITKI